ncbi:MAG: CBS domain-containing protein [Candidatus Syntrophoarchaeum sp. WYZ-LMO15]|nr:MAG: CBS domain-containing protein [Candidatus Syntrophoarchaeum sp. WYZ-LMO15]
MRTSIEIGRALGIPIRLHITFLLILPPFILIFMQQPPPFGFAEIDSFAVRATLATLTTVVLFGCVIAHELSHSYVAMGYGVKIDSITLFIFGGIASMRTIPKDPRVEARIAIAGPLMSIFLATIFIAVQIPFNTIPGGIWWKGFGILSFSLGAINLVLALFNLLPAFPMDGGRILRAYLVKKEGSYISATRKAVQVGKIFAILMAAFGLLHGGWMLILIAFFIYIAASEEESATIIQSAMEGIKVRDIMARELVTVSPHLTVREFIEFMLRDRHKGYPVVDPVSGELLGVVSLTDVKSVPSEKHDEVTVRDIMSRELITINPDATAAEALRLIADHNIGRVLVIEDGVLDGILSKTDLIRAIEILRG